MSDNDDIEVDSDVSMAFSYLDVVSLVVGDLAQLASQLALAIVINTLAACAFLFVRTILIGIFANF